MTDPKTGGQKGSKLAQLGALDPLAITQVAEVAGFGATKYSRYNFVRGFSWSLAYDALQRHLQAFWSGEEKDPESGLPHLAHAGWHCLALLTFSLRGRGTDDRLHRYLEGLEKSLVEAPKPPQDASEGEGAGEAQVEVREGILGAAGGRAAGK